MRQQSNSRMCFTCGEENPAGVHVHYFEQDDGSVLARFTGQDHHQGYPNRMHGGVIAAILDETIGRAIQARGPLPAAGLTREIRIRYRQPVPLDVELTATGRIMSENGQVIEGAGELRLPDNTLAVETHAVYREASADRVGDADQPRQAGSGEGLKKQPNSRMCFVCGARNPAGLQVRFYERADGSILARFTPTERHVDDAGNLNTAAIAAAMDEVMGRAIMIPYAESIWGVTAELSFTFLRPAPIGVALTVVGRITGEKSRTFEGTGELLLPDGCVAVEGRGRYVKLNMVTLGGFDPVGEEWYVRPD